MVTSARILVGGLCLGLCAFALPAAASTLTLVFDTSAVAGVQSGVPTLTLNFGNSTDNGTEFTGADFVSRIWTDLNLLDAGYPLGSYPDSNIAHTTASVSGNVYPSPTDLGAGFTYTETDASLGFIPITLSMETSTILKGPFIFNIVNGVNGFSPRFYLGSSTYNATGTAADFASVSSVPLPAALPLFGSAVGGTVLASLRRRRRQRAA